HLDAGPAIFAKGAFAAEQTSIRGNKLIFGIAKRFGSRPAVELIEQRLGIEGFEMAGAAGHEQKDHRFRLGMGKMRRLGSQRISRSGAEAVVVKQGGQGESTEAAKGISEKSTTIGEQVHGNPVSGSINVQEGIQVEYSEGKLAQRLLGQKPHGQFLLAWSRRT